LVKSRDEGCYDYEKLRATVLGSCGDGGWALKRGEALNIMRKHLIAPISHERAPFPSGWLDLSKVAVAEITSENGAYPIECALLPGDTRGWRAGAPGTQTIRLIFDEPQTLKRISLAFEETETKRTQEFVLRWSPDAGQSYRDIVRQQWNFSPPDTISEIETYTVDLSNVTVLELVIVPDQSGGQAHASLENLRLS
jgi:hypothetical protein